MDSSFNFLVVVYIAVKIALQLTVLILSDKDQYANSEPIKILAQIAIGLSGVALVHVIEHVRLPKTSRVYILAYIIIALALDVAWSQPLCRVNIASFVIILTLDTAAALLHFSSREFRSSFSGLFSLGNKVTDTERGKMPLTTTFQSEAQHLLGQFVSRFSGMQTQPDSANPIEENRGRPERRISPAERRGSPAERRGSPAERRGSPVERRGSPAERRGSPADVKNGEIIIGNEGEFDRLQTPPSARVMTARFENMRRLPRPRPPPIRIGEPSERGLEAIRESEVGATIIDLGTHPAFM